MKKHSVSIPTALMLMLLAVVCTFNITYFTATEYYNGLLDDLEAQESRYGKLKTVTDIVEKYFVADYDEEEALEMAVAGYVAGLGDQWSSYYTAEQTAAIEEDEANQYVGIGITYQVTEDSRYEVVSVMAGGPADQAGMLPGDEMVAVDGLILADHPEVDDLATLVKGEIGTPVTIAVLRAGEEISFTITRDIVLVQNVTSQMLEGSIGYITIAEFGSNVDKDFLAQLDELTQQGAKGFVLDVRNNPGGYVNVMVNMLDALLPEGIVITMVDKEGKEIPLSSDAKMLGLPLTVITNENSISAAEFFAAALQEYGVATVVGTKTSGKGYSQQSFDLADGSSVHLSTTRYYTPKGNSLADTGVTPDQTVELPIEDLYNLLSGKLEVADDEQFQAAIQAVSAMIAAQAQETPAE